MFSIDDKPFKEFSSDLVEFFLDLRTFVSRFIFEVEGDLPKLKKELEREFENQLGMLRFIHSSNKWKAEKEKMIRGEIANEGFERLSGQGKVPVVSRANWMATGTMQDELLRRINNARMNVEKRDDGFDATMTIGLGGFVDGEDGQPYPLTVDDKIRERSGQGIFDLLDEGETGQRFIFELFVNDIDKMLARFFPDTE